MKEDSKKRLRDLATAIFYISNELDGTQNYCEKCNINVYSNWDEAKQQRQLRKAGRTCLKVADDIDHQTKS